MNSKSRPRIAGSPRGAAVVFSILVALAAAWTAGAQEEIDRTFPLSPGGKLIVHELLSGSVSVTGWDRAEVRITGLLSRGVEEMYIDAKADRIDIEFEYRKGRFSFRGDDEDTRLEIRVPAGAGISIGTVSADISASQLKGDVELSSVSGELRLDGELQSVTLESVSGNITVAGGARDLGAETVSGDIAITGSAAQVDVESVSGDIELTGGPFPEVHGETVSGDISLLAPLAPKGEYDLASHSGDVTLTVTEATDAEFELSTFSGDIDLGAFAKTPKSRRSKSRSHDEDFELGHEASFTLGDGSAEVEVTTFSGDIILERP